jgi:hypothetical protein
MAIAHAALNARQPVGWLRERDVDLLLCSELYADGAFARWLGERIGAPSASFRSAFVSHSEVDGETDLAVIYDADGRSVIALIENKIDASFQPEQPVRYAARRERWRQMEGVGGVLSVLIAPEAYFAQAGSELFDLRISYEQVCTVLTSSTDGRSAFLADVLRAGVDAHRRGYVMVPDELASAVWKASWQLSREITPKLNFELPDDKPGRSTWFYFRTPEGFMVQDRKRVCIVLKAERGQADLQFAGTSAAELESRASHISLAGMSVAAAAKSASIRIRVPVVNFTAAPAGQTEGIRAGLEGCELLRRFYIEHRSVLAAW